MKALLSTLAALAWAATAMAGNLPPVQTVFVIVMENQDWASFEGSTNAPYINGTLLPLGAHCEQYYNPPGLHPSEPNYLWLEAGTNFGIVDDKDPASNHQSTTNHLAAQLERAGIAWKAYQEDIPGATVPLACINGYAPKHNPFVFFDDMTGTNDPADAYGLAHIRPYEDLAGDLASNAVARYNFITPNLCHDGHDLCPPQNNAVRQVDDWLAGAMPPILASAAYSNNGAVFITWDEGAGGSDGPIGMMLLSPLARGGYANGIPYTHSSLLRTLQGIFGVSPWLGDAANAIDLSDLFAPLAIGLPGPMTNGCLNFTITGVIPGQDHFVETSTDLATWQVISTNCSSSNSFSFSDMPVDAQRYYRVRKNP